MQDENTATDPEKKSPKQSEYKVIKVKQQLSLPAYSVTALKFKML